MKFIKAVLVFAVLMLAGCLGDQSAAPRTEPPIAIRAFGSLADANNPADIAASVGYTHLARFRHRAAGLLNAQKISAAEAQDYQSAADALRTALDTGRAQADIDAIRATKTQIDNLNQRLDAIK